jgi:membrane dipeptidase
MAFHDDCLVLDGHTDLPTRLWEAPADLSQRLGDRHIDLPRLLEGGVDALVAALYVPGLLSPEAGWEHVLALHRATLAGLGLGPEPELGAGTRTGGESRGRKVRGQEGRGFEIVASAEQLRRAVKRGNVAVVFAIENGRPLVVAGTLEAAAAMGVRYVTLTHWRTHEWCDSSTDDAAHGGLSSEGVGLVREMNRRGILADVSHVSDDAVRHVLDVAIAPPLASHSSARSLCDQPRNLPDELIREIGRRGGLVMANSYPAFVGPAAARADAARKPLVAPAMDALHEAYMRDPRTHWRQIDELLAEHPLPRVPLSAYVDHVIRLIDCAGEEHVGIGTDFDGIPETLEGFEDVSRFPSLTAALLDRGVDRAGVRLILGENFVRLLAEAERLAG